MRSEYDEKKFDFVEASRKFFIVSIIVTLIGIVSVAVRGLNYGIDFQSGTSVDIAISKALEKETVEEFLNEQALGEYQLTTAPTRLTIRFKDALDEAQERQLRTNFSAQIDGQASYEVNIVDADIAIEQQRNALIGMLVACIGIIAYMSVRFEWRFGLAAVVGLAHNAFFVITMFSIFQWQVNLPFIIAVLTILGYTVNDTVVIFDRIRENLRFAKLKTKRDIAQLVNRSIWQTLTRSINTVLTVVFAAVALFVFGSESIRYFSLALIIGLIVGAYSSIFIASPLWLLLRGNSVPKRRAKAAS